MCNLCHLSSPSPFLWQKCQAKIKAVISAADRKVQPGPVVLKRIKSPSVQFQLLNLLPSPFIGIFLVLYQVPTD